MLTSFSGRLPGMLLLLGCLWLAACQPPSLEQKTKKTQSLARKDVLATVGRRIITVQDFRLAVENLSSLMRRRMSRFSNQRAFLLKLVMYEILRQESLKKGLVHSLRVQEVKNRTAIELLVKRISSQVNTLKAPQAALKAMYQKNLKRFMEPERRGLQHILFEVPYMAKETVWTERKKIADAAFLVVQKANQEKGGFGKMALKFSQDLQTREKQGTLGFASRKESRWGKTITNATFKLEKIGDIVMVRTARGFHILRLNKLVKAHPRSFAKVRDQLRADWLRKKQDEHFRNYLKKLRKQTKVTLNKANWSALKKSLKP